MPDYRIRTTDSLLDVIVNLSEGNPGAVTVMAKALAQGEAIDPDSVFGGMGAIRALDGLQIYGSHIWLLFKDLCRQDLTSMLGVLRAVQLGFLSPEALRVAIVGCEQGIASAIDVPALLAQVKAYLPRFGATAPAAEEAR